MTTRVAWLLYGLAALFVARVLWLFAALFHGDWQDDS